MTGAVVLARVVAPSGALLQLSMGCQAVEPFLISCTVDSLVIDTRREHFVDAVNAFNDLGAQHGCELFRGADGVDNLMHPKLGLVRVKPPPLDAETLANPLFNSW